MRNEGDLRERIHCERKETAAGGGSVLWAVARGGAWRARTMAPMTDLEVARRDILAEEEDLYPLLKMIL